MTAHDDTLADRLNAEPAIFKGCSSSELGFIVGVAVVVWLPASLLLAGLLGAVTMGFGLAGVGVVGTVVATASLFQRLKRNRPDGYYQQRFVIWLDDRGLRRNRGQTTVFHLLLCYFGQKPWSLLSLMMSPPYRYRYPLAKQRVRRPRDRGRASAG